MSQIVVFAEFRGCRYLFNDIGENGRDGCYFNFPSAESAASGYVRTWPNASFFVADIAGRSYGFNGDCVDFSRAYDALFPPPSPQTDLSHLSALVHWRASCWDSRDR